MKRRLFSKALLYAAIGTVIERSTLIQSQTKEGPLETIAAREFTHLFPTQYKDISHSDIVWKPISKGLDFTRVEVYKADELVDVVASVKIDSKYNKIRVFNSFDYKKTVPRNIEEWQAITGATVMINSAQYMGDPYYMPCALVICDGVQKGPKFNSKVAGMLVAEPNKSGYTQAELLDFEYDQFDYRTTPYTQGVQHWMMLLDRQGKIKVGQTSWQANRTVVAKDKENNMLFLTTEGGYFTLHNLGRFLKDSNARKDNGFNVHTAMNMDGGYEADMIVRSPNLRYVTYGEFETYGPDKDATVHNIKIKIPGVIGVFPR